MKGIKYYFNAFVFPKKGFNSLLLLKTFIWNQNNAVYICKRIMVLQTKMKVLRKINMVSVNEVLQEENMFCNQK